MARFEEHTLRAQEGTCERSRSRSTADALLVGRQTFESLRSYWPQQSNDSTGISNYLNRVQKFVVSSTMRDPEWQHSTVLSGDPIEEVRTLKGHALIAAGLVDEYRLFVYPVVQGRGRPRFPDGFECPSLRLIEAKAFRRGITYSPYARS
jgi:dihydrofolate reductase